jgi:hypothetical protein
MRMFQFLSRHFRHQNKNVADATGIEYLTYWRKKKRGNSAGRRGRKFRMKNARKYFESGKKPRKMSLPD